MSSPQNSSSPKLASPPPQPIDNHNTTAVTGTVVTGVEPLPGSTDTRSFDNITEINWSRAQDNRLRDLKTQLDKDGKLPSDLQDEYETLSKQYVLFEEEGIKRLTANQSAAASASPQQQKGSGNGFFDFLGKTADFVSEGASKLKPHVQEAGRAAWFYSSLGVTAAAPGYIGKKLGLTDRYDHWNWIISFTKTNRQGGLILGGIPVMTKVGNSGNHLKQIHDEAREQGSEMGMVVSIVLPSEMEGFGMNFVRFAKHQDWKDEFGKDFRCRLLPIEDNTANGFSYDLVMTTLDEMNEVMLTGKTVYVHCAKGVGRSLTLVVCYLMVFLNKNPDEALAHAKACRHQVSPNKVQLQFIRSFYAMYKRIESLENEERKKKYDQLPNVGLEQLLKQQEEKDIAKATENSLKNQEASPSQPEPVVVNKSSNNDDDQQEQQPQQQQEPPQEEKNFPSIDETFAGVQ